MEYWNSGVGLELKHVILIMKRCRVRLFVCMLLAFCGACSRGPERPKRVDFASCLKQMASTATFSERPLGRAGMVSTYDRTGGNLDGGLWQLTGGPGPDGLATIAQLKGPGCVWRIWMTSIPAERWLFFFDGEKKPRLSLTTDELFGGKMPFIRPLSDLVSSGRCSYVPIPYGKSLRIAIDMPKLKPASRSLGLSTRNWST